MKYAVCGCGKIVSRGLECENCASIKPFFIVTEKINALLLIRAFGVGSVLAGYAVFLYVFFGAFFNGGTIIVDVNNWGEMWTEAIIIVTGFVALVLSLAIKQPKGAQH